MQIDEKNQVIHLKQPRLLRIGGHNNCYDSQTKMVNQYEYETNLTKARINKLNNSIEKERKEEEKHRLNKALTSFYKNPFCYMDYLVKKYFKEKENTLENIGLKQEMTRQFNNLCLQIQNKISNYTRNEQRKLKLLQNILERKINKNGKTNELNDIQNIKFNDDEGNLNPQDIYSEGLINDDKIILNRLFNNEKNFIGVEGVITKGDSANMIITDKTSELYKDKIFEQALSCLKGDKLEAPKNQFLSVNNMTLKEMEDRGFVEAQNLRDIKKDFKISSKDPKNKNKKKSAYTMLNPNEQKQNREILNNIKNCENDIIDDMTGNINGHIKNMAQYNKEQKDLVNYLQKKLNKDFEENAIKLAMTKLTICNKNLENYKNDIDKVQKETIARDIKDRQILLDKDYEFTNTIVKNFMDGHGNRNFNAPITNEQINKLYNVYSNKKGNKNNSKLGLKSKSKNKFKKSKSSVKFSRTNPNKFY